MKREQSNTNWLRWVQKLQAIAQTGLTYGTGPYDLERYEALMRLAAEMAATQTGADFDVVYDLFSQDQGYATPKIDVRGGVFQDDAILLVQERADGNRWTLPGGWVDVGDSPATAVTREIVEESGYHTHPLKLVACFDRNNHPHPPIPFHTFKLFFLCELLGGEPTSSLETADIAFFRRDEIPADNLSLSRVTLGQIEMLFAHHANPILPTEFD